MNIANLLTARAATSGTSAAIIDESGGRRRIVTFDELDDMVARTASHLQSLSLRPGDPVLVLQPLSLELCVALVAILRAGLVAVFVDPSAGLSHLESACRLAGPRAFLGSGAAHLLQFLSPALRRIPIKFLTRTLIRRALAGTPGGEDGVVAADLPSSAPALIRFTSGSTGHPKPAVRTHGFLLEQLRAIEANFHLTAGQIDLVTMPMFMLPNLAAGVTSILPATDVRHPGRVDPEPLFRQIKDLHPDRLTASPALFHRLADYCNRQGVTFTSLRRLDTGGAPVFAGLLDSMQAMAPHAEVVAVYGSTEAEPIALIRRQDMVPSDRDAMASGSGLLAGRPVPGIALRLLRDGGAPAQRALSESEFEALCVPADSPGEIVVSGPHVHPGQSSDPTREPTKLFVGATVWHRTGDAGRLDSDGRLWLLGRSSARINDARGIVYPFAIEAAVLTDPHVRQAALVDLDGRRILAIESTNPSQAPALPAWVSAKVDEVRLISRIPLDRRHNAKVDYAELHRALRSKSPK